MSPSLCTQILLLEPAISPHIAVKSQMTSCRPDQKRFEAWQGCRFRRRGGCGWVVRAISRTQWNADLPKAQGIPTLLSWASGWDADHALLSKQAIEAAGWNAGWVANRLIRRRRARESVEPERMLGSEPLRVPICAGRAADVRCGKHRGRRFSHKFLP